MKRAFAILVAGVLVASFAGPAMAGKKAKPAPVKMYLHGGNAVGEADSFFVVAEGYLPMDTTEPSGSEPKSRWITNYFGGPNTECSGNNLFPVWSGPLSGRVTGDVKVTLHTVGTPGNVVVRIWPDIPAGSTLCDTTNPVSPSDNYVDPSGEAVAALPAGHGTVEVILENVDMTAAGSFIMQVSPQVAVDIPDPGGSILEPFVSRILYDTADFASSIEFLCTPAKGSASCTG